MEKIMEKIAIKPNSLLEFLLNNLFLPTQDDERRNNPRNNINPDKSYIIECLSDPRELRPFNILRDYLYLRHDSELPVGQVVVIEIPTFRQSVTESRSVSLIYRYEYIVNDYDNYTKMLVLENFDVFSKVDTKELKE